MLNLARILDFEVESVERKCFNYDCSIKKPLRLSRYNP